LTEIKQRWLRWRSTQVSLLRNFLVVRNRPMSWLEEPNLDGKSYQEAPSCGKFSCLKRTPLLLVQIRHLQLAQHLEAQPIQPRLTPHPVQTQLLVLPLTAPLLHHQELLSQVLVLPPRLILPLTRLLTQLHVVMSRFPSTRPCCLMELDSPQV
jgi:hypothetical protein